jgi:hypothetical protein
VNYTAIGFSCSPSLAAANGNIAADPLFTANGNGLFGDNFVPGNYRLQMTSPCVNAATNLTAWMPGATDLDGLARVQGRQPDMGAYETYVPPRGSAFLVR